MTWGTAVWACQHDQSKKVVFEIDGAESKITFFNLDVVFIGDHSDRLAPGWQHGREGVVRSQRDPSISQRATLRCCGRSWHRLLLECTWTILRKQGQLQAHTLRLLQMA